MPRYSDYSNYNMYYSGAPLYSSSSPYSSYTSSGTPLGTSFSASYLGTGSTYSNHSSLGGYGRTPIASRWIPPSSRNYSPILSTISERGTSSPIRINSPRRIPISKSYASTAYTPRPININTADIDVSRDKYKTRKLADIIAVTNTQNERTSQHIIDNGPFMPRVDGKPETGIDSSPGHHRNSIKRGRTVVRLHTLKRKERDSPRKPLDSHTLQNDDSKTNNEQDTSVPNTEEISIGWRDKLSDDLQYKDKREKKTIGEKLVEKFKIKENDNDETVSAITDKVDNNLYENIPEMKSPTVQQNKSLDRRCSMELLAEQANVLDSLIRGENLSTVSLDLSKVGVGELSHAGSIKRRKNSKSESSLQTTKSDHALHERVKSLSYTKEPRQFNRRSLKKSSSGGSICRLDSIIEFPKEPIQFQLPIIEESRLSIKKDTVTAKPKMKAKITSSVEIAPPTSPLKFRIDDVTVEEKLCEPKKEISFSSEVDTPNKDVTSRRICFSKNVQISTIEKDDSEDADSDNGNFWSKIGKRETVYLNRRKQKIQDDMIKNRRAMFWYPDEESGNNEDIKLMDESVTVTKETPQDLQENKITTDNSNTLNTITKLEETDEKCHKTNSILDKVKTLETKLDNLTSIPPNEDSKTKSIEDVIEKQCVNKSNGPKNTTEDTISENIINKDKVNKGVPNKEDEIKTLTEDFNELITNSSRENSSKEVIVKESIDKNIETQDSKTEMLEEAKNNDTHIEILNTNEILTDNNLNSNDKSTADNKTPSEEKSNSAKVNDKVKSRSSKTISNDLSEDHKQISPNPVKDPLPKTLTKNNTNLKQKVHKEPAVRKCKSNVEKNVNDKVNIEILPKTSLNNDKLQLHKNSDKKKNNESEGKSVEKVETVTMDTNHSVQYTNSEVDCMSKESIEDSKDDGNHKPLDVADLKTSSQTNNIPIQSNLSENVTEKSANSIKEREVNKAEIKVSEETKSSPDLKENSDCIVKLPVPPPKKKPVKQEAASRPLIATPRPLQKKAPQVNYSSSSESSSEDETSDDDADESSDESTECECETNPDGRTSTGSNDSGFDSSAPTSPAGFTFIKKGGDSASAVASGSNSSATQAADSSDIIEQELEASHAYRLFRKTGRFTAPARSIPRFRKYTVDDFHFIKVLGKGSFGKVMLAELRETEYYYAVKCLKKDVVLEDDDVECTLIERKVLALGTNHPYLCHLFATFQTDTHLFFVMEYLNGGDLMFHIQQSGRFPEARARFYAAEIVSGLKFLHKRGIVYRDLKLDNILLDFDGHVRIADFGMCKLQIYLDKTADTFCGTPDYMAPEIIKGLKYSQTVDWWSFGVLLYEMLIGQSPFSGCDEDELFWSICNEMPSYPRFLSQESLTILTRLLDKDARTRLGGTECMHGDILHQDFFNSIQWDKLERRELEAPFKPRVRHPMDTQYFDRAFTGERPRLTAVEPQVLRSMDQEPFRGFSYTNPNATDR